MIPIKTFLYLCLVGLLSCSAVQAQFSIRASSTNLLDGRFAGASATVSGGAVNAITVRNSGAGYPSAPAVVVSPPPSGTTATATATVSNGLVTMITINSGGSGYTTVPNVTIARPPIYNPPGTPVTTTSQYAGQANTAATSGPLNATAVGNAIAGFASGRFPRGFNRANPSSPTVTVVLGRSSFGNSFASGVPRYSFGDEIPRPSLNWKGDLVAETYWRINPVEPGEIFTPAGTSNLGALGAGNVPLAAGTVTVNSSTGGSTTVIVASVPDTLTPGATLLGKQVAYISGTTVTLVTPTSITTSAPAAVSFTPRMPYYYSPHAQRVFASQPGRVTITWVSNLPDTSGVNEATATYKFRQETFAVASSSRVPVRTIYWTGGGFSAPAVGIPAGRVSVVNPVYNSFVPPGVANAYTAVGANPGSMTMPEEHRTLWFEQVGNAKALYAYNVEGNMMVEYLGPQSSAGVHEFIGADVVQIKTAPEIVTVTTSVGDQLLPREGSPAAGDELLKPASLITDPDALLGFYLATDGVAHYFAEKENTNPDRAQISWMQQSDAAIHFLPEPATPNLNIEWPKRFCAYLLKWPESLADYVAVNVQSNGNSVVNAIQFDPSSLPENKYQDCAPQVETEIDPTTQRLLVDFSNSRDKTNRTLLKFIVGGSLWYQRLYIQEELMLGQAAVADPDGAGPLIGRDAVYTINDMNGDGISDYNLTATVGTRLEPPPGCEPAGYVTGGTCYSQDAYLNPFEVGFPTAAAKAIIPVNAAPNHHVLKVWWSKKITPPSSKLKPFYVPSIAATYTVSYPASPQELVIASGKGLENPGLTPEQAEGSIYTQNDNSAIGYNPNEEHALMLGGNVYALRDDLNDLSAAQYSSSPFVLISYHEAASGRPAMRVAKVVRSNATYPLSWNKPAGTPVQAPMPLALMPLPLTDENDFYSVKNSEVAQVTDHATSGTAPTGSTVPVNYNSFTFIDRKGMHWLYRGPHQAAANPSYGMRYYYQSMPGFFIPGINLAAQPPVGTIMPYIAAADGENKVTGLATTLTYFPKWPDDVVFGAQAASVPVLETAQTLMLPTGGLPQVRGQTSAQVAYQQSRANSVANGGTTLDSVLLSDPTRQKTHAFGGSGGLLAIPSSVLTTQASGFTYFQGLPPHLQNRFYFDPNRGNRGSLVLNGEFVDVPAGVDYLNLNALSAADVAILNDLCPATDSANRSRWEAAINGLSTQFETFRESTTVPGTYVVDTSLDHRIFDRSALPDVQHPDTAVDSYALSSTGNGNGYVTLVFGNGEAFTDSGDPVVMQIIKVSPTLHQGDLKVLLSSNPLDEQVTLRHSGDYGAKPENFEFEWRYGFPVNGSFPAQSGATATGRASLGVWPTNFGTINSGTNRYSAAPSVTISGGGGTGATATANLGLSSFSFTISPGTHTYSAAPTVTISQGGGTGATATALRGLTAASFTITPNAQRYSVAPSVAISGGGGSGATATANLTTGAVSSVTITNPGSGYTAAPSITFNGGTVSTAGAVPTGVGNDTRFAVVGISITSPGSGFNSVPTIGFSGGTITTSGTAPSGTGNATNFMVSGIGISTTGTGYTTAPTISFSGGTITFTGTAPSATGNATGFVVAEVLVNAAGSQYSNTPVVTLSGGGGSGAAATAVVGPTKSISSIAVTSRGGGYSSPPAVTLEAPIAPINIATATANWLKPNGTLGSSILVGGSPTAALSDPAVLMGDSYFTMAYRRKANAVTGAPAGAWSNWTSPALVEGWIKRVLAKITPFNQRMTDLSTSAINTDVSMLTQAGTRWEGDIALNLNNINDVGLIEIYETILNRGKSFTVGNGVDFSTTNDALLLAAGYLNDLYMILGNEAYADAANPTISIDDQSTATEVNTSRFSFEGQVASSLDEELALLRGRDDFTSPGTSVNPSYNRLFWNYTRGINSGEALYATNYNIKEKTGSPTANGILDAADAQRMFPQGHGDAYGHYLTAVTNYYKLLTHPNFTWTPRAEAVTVLGQTVLVDYKDERKFAAASMHVAKSAQQILALVHRKSYSDDTSRGWTNLRDTARNSTTGEERNWGLDEWTSRSAQGSFFHWVTGNSMLLAEDKVNTGLRKVDRTTVPELLQLVTAADSFQTTIDNANAHLNPLGLSPDAIAFDISPSELRNGVSHYEQISSRALNAVLNARGAFDQAAKMTRLLRNQENQVTDKNTVIEDQEGAYEGQLVEIYGSPYPGDVGPGKTYSQGYQGPDLLNWFVLDRPSTLYVNPATAVTVTLKSATGSPSFSSMSVDQIKKDYAGNSTPSSPTAVRTLRINPSSYVQFSDTVSPGVSMGSRPQSGQLQQALLDAEVARAALHEANFNLQAMQTRFAREGALIEEMVSKNQKKIVLQNSASGSIAASKLASSALRAVAEAAEDAAEAAKDTSAAVSQAPPWVVGPLAVDATSAVRSAIRIAGNVLAVVSYGIKRNAAFSADVLDGTFESVLVGLEGAQMALDFSHDEKQAVYEYKQTYNELIAQVYTFNNLSANLQTADQNVKNLLATAQSILSDREAFRKRAAAVISGYRTNDLTFRTFRDESLEEYRSLYDLAGRYTYLAAKSYDYETGLLGTPQGKAVISKIVSSRALGDLSGDTPRATTSSLGDSGLAGSLARLNADFSVVKGRLGINNPDQYGTLFSLRSELYRLGSTPTANVAWRQVLEQSIKADLMSDPDVVRYCNNLKKPDGSAVPGFIIPFSSTIQHGKNFFGLPIAAGDHFYSPSSYSTKISSAGIVLKGYVGMDPFAQGMPGAGGPNLSDPNALSATPYLYLIPCGEDSMLAPPLGDTNTLRTWTVHDQALPLPFNLGASAFNTTQFFDAAGTLSEEAWIQRKHQGFRPVSDPAFFYSNVPSEFTNSRLVGRSVWNSKWKLVIPAYMLSSNQQDGMNRFCASVEDIQLFLRTYSHSGN